MTLDQLHTRLTQLLANEPQLRHLPVIIRAKKHWGKRGKPLVMDLRFVAESSLELSDGPHVELSADLRA